MDDNNQFKIFVYFKNNTQMLIINLAVSFVNGGWFYILLLLKKYKSKTFHTFQQNKRQHKMSIFISSKRY